MNTSLYNFIQKDKTLKNTISSFLESVFRTWKIHHLRFKTKKQFISYFSSHKKKTEQQIEKPCCGFSTKLYTHIQKCEADRIVLHKAHDVVLKH